MSHPLILRLIRPLTLFIALGALFYVGGLVWAGRTETLAGIGRIGAPLLSASSLLWRFARWQWLGQATLLAWASLWTAAGPVPVFALVAILAYGTQALVVQLLAAGASQPDAVAIAITTRLLTRWLAIALGVVVTWYQTTVD